MNCSKRIDLYEPTLSFVVSLVVASHLVSPSLSVSKFRHIPLYLEWAPMGVFSGPAKKQPEIPEGHKEDQEQLGTGKPLEVNLIFL